MDLKHLYHIKHPTSCHGRCRAPGCFVVLILCFSVVFLLIGWGGVGWDVNIHVHVTLMILCWSWGVGFPKKLPKKRALVTWGPTPRNWSKGSGNGCGAEQSCAAIIQRNSLPWANGSMVEVGFEKWKNRRARLHAQLHWEVHASPLKQLGASQRRS